MFTSASIGGKNSTERVFPFDGLGTVGSISFVSTDDEVTPQSGREHGRGVGGLG